METKKENSQLTATAPLTFSESDIPADAPRAFAKRYSALLEENMKLKAALDATKAAPAAPVQTAETDISRRLRAKAKQPFGPEDFSLLTQAADECDRFYNGMMNWKANAQAKDRTIIELREAAKAAPVHAEQAQAEPVLERDGWKIVDSLIYRLDAKGANCDEINVTMVNGSRSPGARHDAAVELLTELTSALPAQAERAEQAAAVRAAEWISVEDRLPEDHQTVAILYWPYNNHDNVQAAGAAVHIDGTFYTPDGDEHHWPSHWSPLPAIHDAIDGALAKEAAIQAPSTGEASEQKGGANAQT